MAIAGINSISQAAQGLSNLTLVSPILSPGYGPINVAGQSLGPALVFDYEGENTVKLQSEITDHFIETNSSISAHIAIKPEKITVHGFKGELTNLFPSFVPPASQVFSVLQAIGAFAPGFSVSAMNVINEAAQAYSAVDDAARGAVAAWNKITGENNNSLFGTGIGEGANQNKQQKMFAQWYGYWSSQFKPPYTPTLFQVQTPWAIFAPCAIEELGAIQDEKTNSMTDFFITFKVMRFVSTVVSTVPIPAGRAVDQYAPNNVNGSVSLAPSTDASSQFANSFGPGF